jgi:YD repeat-containing protein
MFCKYVFLVLLLFAVIIKSTSGQNELNQVVPLTPNAAAIARYGETPIGYFTGIPIVNIPVYDINSNDLSIPLVMNYHAGGNKVEDISSWVGLGWSLGTIPSISRGIRGLPDDIVGGYFSNYNGVTVEKVRDSLQAISHSFINYKMAIYEGKTDTEADIFIFTLPNKSGKFFWNQTKARFYTTPFSNIKIEWIGMGFRITDDDGTVYTFLDTESSREMGSTVSSDYITSWMVTKMQNANKTDSITFDYDHESNLVVTTNVLEKNIFGGCLNNASVSTTKLLSSRPISRISFKNGHVDFIRRAIGRQDLNGGYALDTIKIFSKNSLLKQVSFNTHYRTVESSDVACVNASIFDKKKMFLSGMTELDKNSKQTRSYYFQYDSIIGIPCRLSAAQDYWGYYNGRTSNLDLTPEMTTYLPSGSVTIPGADRDPDSNYTQFGILKKIIYPTGGYTEFAYENNTISNESGSISNYIQASVSLEGANYFSVQQNHLLDTFVVNNPPNSRLNGNNPNGGAILSINAGGFGCNLTNGSSPCANINIHGISSSSGSSWIPVSANMPNNTHHSTGIYLPNGTYVIEASFDQNPPEWHSFYIMATWQIADTSLPNRNRLVGGLRLKSKKDFDGLASLASKIYKYANNLDSETSSGDLFGTSNFVGFQDKVVFNYLPNGYNFTETYCCQIATQATSAKISHSGSFVGYKSVLELSDSSRLQGMTKYVFSHAKDAERNIQPFAPEQSMEIYRGNLLSKLVYKTDSNKIVLLNQTDYEYITKPYKDLASISLKAQLYRNPVINAGIMAEEPIYYLEYYENVPEWTAISKMVQRYYGSYDTLTFLKQSTNYTYNPISLQASSIELISSKGDTILEHIYRPSDVTLVGQFETARQVLIGQNRLSTILKEEHFRNSKLVYRKVMNFAIWGSTQQALPKSTIISYYDNLPQNMVTYDRFDSKGNLLQSTSSDGIQTCYIWGYRQTYPVAKIVGASLSDIQSLMSEESSDFPSLQNLEGHSLISYLDQLRIEVGNFNPLCQVFTYTYEPLIGLASETDSRGRVNYYNYDPFGRLRSVQDHDGNILKQFCYNYQGQPDNCQLYYNVSVQQTFHKNDCASGFTGLPYTYIVAAGTHAGTSQLEANDKAMQDLANNGQSQANIHGTCLPVYYNVAIAEYFYNANCPNSTLDGVWVVIPAGAYSSTAGQAAADQLARDAAQQYANQNGTCSQSGFPLYGSNNTGASMTLLLRNTQTQTSYYFFLGAYQGWSQLGTIPPGNYDIELISDGYNSFNYSVGCGFWGSAAGYTSLYNVYLDGSCANIEITF